MWFYWREKSLHLHIHLQPRASTDKIVGTYDDCLKIRLTAPPLEGRANKYLLKFLAKCFKVPESRVIITHGEHSRKKWVKIDDPQRVPPELSEIKI